MPLSERYAIIDDRSVVEQKCEMLDTRADRGGVILRTGKKVP